MQVTVDATCVVVYKCQLLTFQKGESARGDIAAYLVRSGAAVTPADDDAQALADATPEDEAPVVESSDDDAVAEADALEDIDIATSTIDQVLAWVGDNAEKALAAHAVEEARGDRARSTLLVKLSELGLV